jgi:gas vesicle protein
MKMTKRDILEALGIETRRENNTFLSGLLVGLGAGALVGGACALLFAPKRGSELRTAIGEKSRDVMNRSRDMVNKLKNRGRDMSSDHTSEFEDESIPGGTSGYKPTV